MGLEAFALFFGACCLGADQDTAAVLAVVFYICASAYRGNGPRLGNR